VVVVIEPTSSSRNPSQIIFDINWCTTLLILVIHSVHVHLEVILKPCRSCLLLASAMVQVVLLTEASSTYISVDVLRWTKCRHHSQQFMYCRDCWLPRKFCLGCCLDTDLRNSYLGSDLVICGRFPWKVPTSTNEELLSFIFLTLY
jgi:hypothetical protein